MFFALPNTPQLTPAVCPAGVVISEYPPTPTLYPEVREEDAAI